MRVKHSIQLTFICFYYTFRLHVGDAALKLCRAAWGSALTRETEAVITEQETRLKIKI